MNSLDLVIVAITVSIAMLILSSVLFFITGYVCGCCCHKHKQSSNEISMPQDVRLSEPDYEIVLPKTISKEHDDNHDFKLDNVLYGQW